MTEEKKPLKIEFAPGCFDSFEGTQEELNDLIKEIERMFESGEAQEMAVPLDIDELLEEDPDVAEALFRGLAGEDGDIPKRNLQ